VEAPHFVDLAKYPPALLLSEPALPNLGGIVPVANRASLLPAPANLLSGFK
jgi:hypothetical protein